MNRVLIGCCFLAFGLTVISAAPIGQSQPKQQSGRKPMTKEDVKNYLIRFGYWQSGLRSNNPGNEFDLKNSLETYQRQYGLNVTGVADNATLELMATPRCGLPDIISTDRHKRYVLFGTKWPRSNLTYRFQNYYSKLPVNVTRSLIQRSLKDWSDVASLSFTESKSRAASLKLLFASLDHGDGEPFDGKGFVLAHAFPPTDGRVHFDSDELWTNSSYGVNLRQVATHEIGHALGLNHSNVRNAVMYSLYEYKKNFALDLDDIQGIQALYGAPTKSRTYSTKALPTTLPRPCPLDIKEQPGTTIPPASPSAGSQSSSVQE